MIGHYISFTQIGREISEKISELCKKKGIWLYLILLHLEKIALIRHNNYVKLILFSQNYEISES